MRPLIVAFMGGTGVGKSALLNRLAGKPIAKSGVARPTSKEITIFHHQNITLPQLPLTDIRVANHDDDSQKTWFGLTCLTLTALTHITKSSF